jgi:hypothetical protein
MIERIQRYAADPMAFFQDVALRPGGPRFGDVMTPEQRDFLEVVSPCLLALAKRQRPPKRGVWVEAVKGWGKDSIGALCVLWLLCFAPWSVAVQVAADDQQQGGEVKRALEDWIRANLWLSARIDVQRWKIVNTATGGTCEVLTSDASGSHGSRPDMILLNEVSHVQSEDFASTILDNFAKMPDAFGILATNAGFLGSWAWRWRELYRVDSRWYFIKIIDTPSWQSSADIEEARRRNPPARFRRLYRGEWVAAGGDNLPADAIAKAVVHTGPVFERWLDHFTIGGIGVDAGVSGHHAAVVVLLGSHTYQKLRVARVIDMRPPVRLDAIRDEVLHQAAWYGVKLISLDPWQMLRVAEELVARNLNVEAQHQTGQVLTRQAAALLEAVRDGTLELYDDSLLLEDLYSAKIVERSYGHKVELTENENGHGDRLSALLNILPFMLEALGQPAPQSWERVIGHVG